MDNKELETESSDSKKIVNALLKTIEVEYYSEIKLFDFAARHYITPSYLSLLFFKETGKSFSEALMQTRIKKAMEYLEYTDLSTSRIAELVGYNDRGYFSRVFQNQANMSPSTYRKQQQNKKSEVERYVYVAFLKDDPLLVAQDMRGLQAFSKEYNVNATLEAPEVFGIEQMIEVLEKAIEEKPSGLLICGGNTDFVPFVDKAMESGVPTVTVDADLPESKRLATVTSDWYSLGRRLGAYMANLINYSGKVAVLKMMEFENMELAFSGFKKALTVYPDIELIGAYNDMSKQAEAAKITEMLLNEHPDLSGISTFDSNGAPGVCSVLRNLGLTGRIKITSIDIDPVHLQLVRNGEVQALVGQKRELLTYYGAKMLYDYNHSNLTISLFSNKKNVSNIPARIDPGLIEITTDNLNEYDF